MTALALSPPVLSHFSFPPPGKPAEDEVKLGSLKLKPNTKIMMMGTREESLVGGWMAEKLTESRCLVGTTAEEVVSQLPGHVPKLLMN